jgi:hypothetical protein
MARELAIGWFRSNMQSQGTTTKTRAIKERRGIGTTRIKEDSKAKKNLRGPIGNLEGKEKKGLKAKEREILIEDRDRGDNFRTRKEISTPEKEERKISGADLKKAVMETEKERRQTLQREITKAATADSPEPRKERRSQPKITRSSPSQLQVVNSSTTDDD